MFERNVVNIATVLFLFMSTAVRADSYECLIRPSQVVRVGAPVNGVVAQIMIERGDWVRAGDVIAQLDVTLQEMAIRSAQVRAASTTELRAAEARVEFLSARLKRNQQLKDKSVVAESAIEEIQSELSVAENEVLQASQNQQTAAVELEAAWAEKERRIIRSPISGYVMERGLSVGEYWNENTPLATIAAIDVLHVEAIVGIGAFDAMSLGSKAIVVPEAPVGGSYEATVTVVDRVFDAASGTFGVRLELPNPQRIIPAGLRCEVAFER